MGNKIAQDLLKIEAAYFRPNQPFTWTNGISAPVYCDCRLTLSYPEVRRNIELTLAEIVKKEYPEAECLMGTSTAGIAHAAIISSLLGLPMGYVRGSSIDYGLRNQIEGRCDAGTKVVVIEDVISTGKSVSDVVECLREAGTEVLGVVSIFNYGLKQCLDMLAEKNIKNVSASVYDELIEEALAAGYIKEWDVAKLKGFKEDPREENWMSL